MSAGGTAAKPPPRLRFSASVLLGLAQILIWGGSFFLLAVLANPIHQETGWSLTWIYGALTAGALVSAVLSPKAGVYIARHQGRQVLVASGWIIAAGLCVIAAAPNLAVFVLGWCVIGAGMAGGLYDPLFATLGIRYGQAARPAINAVTLIGGFCTTLAWPVQAWMVEAFGWRITCWAYAAVLAAAIGPLYWKALPKDRGAAGNQPATPGHAPSRSSHGAGTFDPGLYRLLSLVFSIAAILMSAVSVQIIVLLQGTGHSMASAIALSALIGPSMVGVRIITITLKSLPPIWEGLISAGFVAAGLLLISISPAGAALGIICYGIGNGLRALVRGSLPLMLVPPDALATVMGRLARSTLVCQALTPMACGFLITQAGATATLWTLTALAVANMALTVRLRQRVAQHLRRHAPAGPHG